MSTSLTAEEAREYIAALQAFRTAYDTYLAGGPTGPEELRRAVHHAMPGAQEALDACGGGTVVLDPPAAGPTRLEYTGLANVAFLHERPGFRLNPDHTIQAVLDDLDRTEGQLQHMLTKHERLDAEEPGQRTPDQPVFCERGHFIGTGPEASPFCEDCGGRAVSTCPNCAAAVRGRSADAETPVSFCRSCGAPFPWVDRQGRIYQLENLLTREQLDDATALAVREQLDVLAQPDLSEEEQRERWERVKRLAPGLWQSGRAIVEGLVSAALKAQLGL